MQGRAEATASFSPLRGTQGAGGTQSPCPAPEPVGVTPEPTGWLRCRACPEKTATEGTPGTREDR